jgi:vacuolar protein sorting-associated protein 35
MHQSISTLNSRVSPGAAELCLRLFIACAQIADQTGFEEMSYEFFAQALTIYEDSISDSKAQFQAVCILAGALHDSRGFSRENYDTLITKCVLHASKLLKKPDQCRAVYSASHLWWTIEIPQREDDSKNVSQSPHSFHPKTNTFTALPRRQARPRMSAACPPRCRCLHGHRRIRRALC